MDDDELERFVDEWLSVKRSEYAEVQLFAGSGDLGRDVVGFCSDRRHEGDWDNYQCKQLGRSLGEGQALCEVAKVIYHSSRGHYRLPRRYLFVAPNGAARTVRELVAHPARFKATMRMKWDEYCAHAIVRNTQILLDAPLEKAIDSFDFAAVQVIDAAVMLKDPQILPVLVKWFNEDPGDFPRGVAPPEIQPEEQPFIRELLHAYGERDGAVTTEGDALAHATYGDHLRLQRTRYFEAAAFKRYYRDNTPLEYVPNFEDDIYFGIIETHRSTHADTLARIDSVMSQAASVQPAGTLARYARVPVKQGVCHHFANEGRISWKR